MKTIIAVLLMGVFLLPGFAEASRNRISVGAGIADLPNQTVFEISAEFEHRYDAFLGLGGTGEYVFSTPAIFTLAAPEVFLHPLGGRFYVSAAPVFQFVSSTTNTGVRLATLVPIPLGVITILPSAAVEFINGTHLYIFGVGIGF
jgi:hypothetical protein